MAANDAAGERSLNDEKLSPWNGIFCIILIYEDNFSRIMDSDTRQNCNSCFVCLPADRTDRENYELYKLIILRIIKFALMAATVSPSFAGIECVIDTESSMKCTLIFLKFNLSVWPIIGKWTLCVSFHPMLR